MKRLTAADEVVHRVRKLLMVWMPARFERVYMMSVQCTKGHDQAYYLKVCRTGRDLEDFRYLTRAQFVQDIEDGKYAARCAQCGVELEFAVLQDGITCFKTIEEATA